MKCGAAKKIKIVAFMILLPTIQTIHLPLVGKVADGAKKAGEEVMAIPEKLTNFYKSQINIFGNQSLEILDDNENPVKFDLKLPDFNVLKVFSDLNKVVTFKLYTKEYGGDFVILRINDRTALEMSHLNTNRRTYIITHGFMASSDSPSCTLVRYALQNVTDSNIITVDWSPLSKGEYAVARLFVTPVGKHIGSLINFLYENGLNPEDTTLIGHSLGAHAMGIAGQNANVPVNHTIGLDPAWPLFVNVPKRFRLSPDDALHVEVIHTNGGLLGYLKKLGHYDFYPNGGSSQKGCVENLISACSHGRSYKYLAEQIANPDSKFCSFKCNSYSEFKKNMCTNEMAVMGGIRSYPANRGQYYLQTNDREPFSLPTQC